MANGEVLTRQTVGVAHRTLPLGTKVLVKYGRHQRMTLVKDRGPFSGSRSYDLTLRLVQYLGVSSCRSWGVRTVTVTVVR